MLVLVIDQVIREAVPAGWEESDEGPRATEVRNALFSIMSRDREATLVMYTLIKNRSGYS